MDPVSCQTLSLCYSDNSLARDSDSINDEFHDADDDFQPRPHHDENLKPYQRALINAVAPSLFVNVPHPWPVFLFFIFTHSALLCGTVWFLLTNCPINKRTDVTMMFFRHWEKLMNLREKF